MYIRQLLTDVGLAILLAIPLAMSRPEGPPPADMAGVAPSPVEAVLAS